MKAIICVLLLAAVAVFGAEEKKNEKRGLLGLGYGLDNGYYGHGLGLYGGHGLGLYGGHGGYLGGHGGYLGGHGIGLVGHSVAAPIVSHAIAAPAPIISHGGYYGGHGLVGAPLLGLGHGWH